MLGRVILLTFVICFGCNWATAGVNLKNGNFYTTYCDIKLVKNGHELSMVRTYNSHSDFSGWLAKGWGSNWETFLEMGNNGSVVVHENGGGAETRFIPLWQNDRWADAYHIKEAVLEMDPYAYEGEVLAEYFADELARSPVMRKRYANDYGLYSELPVGSTLYSHIRGFQRLIKTEDGFERIFSDGYSDIFNNDGVLVRREGAYGYYVNFHYTNGVLKLVKDSFGSQLFFDWYPNGLLKHTWCTVNDKTTYRYSDDGNLVYSIDAAGNEYGFEYDDNHNMTAVIYYEADGQEEPRKQLIEYSDEEQKVTKITETDGRYSTYSYRYDSYAPESHYWTDVMSAQMGHLCVMMVYGYQAPLKFMNTGLGRGMMGKAMLKRFNPPEAVVSRK